MRLYRGHSSAVWLSHWLLQVSDSSLSRISIRPFTPGFSSPHLVEVRERIRINGELISKEKFVDYFWQCYNAIAKGVQQTTDKVNALLILGVDISVHSIGISPPGSASNAILLFVSDHHDVLRFHSREDRGGHC